MSKREPITAAIAGREIAPVQRAGFSINEYCAAIDLCRASFYNIEPELRPRSVLIGRRRIIIEPPAEYLARLAAAQAGVAASRHGADARRAA